VHSSSKAYRAPDADGGDPQLRVGQIVLVDVIVGQPPRAVEGF